jgi:hypothetical protein
MGNVEVPGIGTPVKVGAQIVSNEKPSTGATIEELKNKISELQTMLMNLLRQLISAYQNRINQIS